MDNFENTQKIEFDKPFIDSEYVSVSDLKICNGRCAHGHIEIDSVKYIVIVFDDDSGYFLPKVYACPYLFDENIIMETYNLKIQEKFYGY